MLRKNSTFSLRAKTLLWVVVFFLTLSALNITTYITLRSYMKDLSSMIDVLVLTNDLKYLTGTATEGFPFEIEEYSLHPDIKKRDIILNKFSKIKSNLTFLKNEISEVDEAIQVELINNMFNSQYDQFIDIDNKIKDKSDFKNINELVFTIKENAMFIVSSIENLISVELKNNEILKVQIAQNTDRNGKILLTSIIFIGILSVSFFYFFFISKNIFVPLNNMRDTMELITNNMNNIKLRVKIDRNDEIGSLGHFFNAMANQIQETQENQETIIQTRTSELELSRAQNIQSAKMAAIGEMAGGIAHEVNTPLGAISLNAEMISKKNQLSENPNEAIEKYAKSIKNICQRISKIINGLKSFSRDSSQEENQDFIIRNLVLDTLEFCSEKFKNHGVEIEVNEENMESKINGQLIHLSQTLLNLLNNAFDAIQDLDDKWIRIEALISGDMINLRVTDCGTGIPNEVVDKMFQPFYTTKDIGKGTGLGLGISLNIIEKHGGRLYYDDQSSNTTFVISLPRVLS